MINTIFYFPENAEQYEQHSGELSSHTISFVPSSDGSTGIIYKDGISYGSANMVLDDIPTEESQHAVKSGGVFDVLESILNRIDALEQKVDPKPASKPAYTVVTTKPTQTTIADMVDPTAVKPTEAITVDMTSITKPTMCYLTYPQEWEVVVDGIIQIPYMVDSNGFEIGATFDAETPLLTTGGVVYRVLDIRLGKGVYKLNFKT